jgi:tetratricopeptide (TPR) repeat protein
LTAGELAYAIGTPEGQESTVSMGNISNPDSVISGQHLIQFTAPISPGSSGGGLFVENGDIVGVTSASLGSDRAQNLNYAIPISYLRAAMNKQPQISEGSPMYYYVQGNLAADKRDWQLAIGYYSKAIELNPNYADAYAARGGIYYVLGKFDLQLRDFLKANQLAPNDSDISYDVATAYEDFGRFLDAINMYKRTLALDPNDKDALAALVLDYLAVGDRRDAVELIPRLSRFDPGEGKQLQLIISQMNP